MADRDENITTRFKADITNLKAGITEANRHIKLANAEFKAAASGMDDWTKSADGISAKLKNLDTVMSEQKKVLANLEKQYELTKEAQGEESTAAENLAIKIANQKAAINKTAKEIDRYNNELDDLKDAEKDAEKAGASLEDELDDLGDAAEGSKDGFSVMKGALADLVSNAISSAASAVKDFVGQLWELPEATKEFRSVFGAVQQSASDSVIGVEGATDAYEQFFAVAADEGQAAEATSHIAGLVNEQGNLQGALDGVIGAWVKYGDSITIEGLAEAADETAKTGTVTGQFADALNWAGKSEDDFNEKLGKLNSKQERQKLIIETLNGLYGENAQKYRENNESLVDANLANLKLLESQSKLAEAVEPLTALMTDLKAKALDAITPAIEALADKLKSVADFVTENIGTLGPIITGVATAFGVLAGALLISNIITAVQKAFSLLNLTLLANPFVLIAAAVAGLVAGLIHLWNTNEDFRNAVKGIWESIKNTFITTLDAIKAAWSTVKTFFSNVAEWIKNAFVTIPAWFKSKFTEAKNKVIEAFSDIKAKFTEILNKIKSVFTADALKDAGMQLLAGLWNGINNKVEWLKSKVRGVVDKIKSWFTGKEGFDEHSPSKWSEKVMRYVFEGMGKGVVFDSKPVKNVINDVKNVIESGLTKTKDNTKKITESIRDNVSKVVDEVYKSLETAQQNYQKNTESFMNSTKLFDAFSDSVDTEGTKSVELITNLEGQVKGMEQYASILENLKGRVSSDFYDYLKSLGIGEISNLRVLQRMSDTSLKYYESLYNKKYDLSKKLSFDDYQKELGTLGVNVNKSLNDIELVAKEAGMKTTLGYAQSLAAAADSSEFKSKIADLTKAIKDAFSEVAGSVQTMSGGVTASGKASNVSTVTNVTNNFNQTNNSPKALSRLTIYRQTKNLLSMKGAQ